MLKVPIHNKKAVQAFILLVLFLLQTAFAATELGSSDLHASEKNDSRCTYDCFELSSENTEASQLDDREDKMQVDKTHCDDCEHCLGCHLSIIAHHFAPPSIFGSRSSYTYLARSAHLHPTNIDRPPIA